MSEEDFEEFSGQIHANRTGLDVLDRHVYPKMFGYKDEFDYYKKVSVDNHIMNCKVPVFCMGSVDDQVCDYTVTPFDLIKSKGSSVFLATTKLGGHGCHMSGTFAIDTWYQHPFMEFYDFLESRQTAVLAQKYGKKNAPK